MSSTVWAGPSAQGTRQSLPRSLLQCGELHRELEMVQLTVSVLLQYPTQYFSCSQSWVFRNQISYAINQSSDWSFSAWLGQESWLEEIHHFFFFSTLKYFSENRLEILCLHQQLKSRRLTFFISVISFGFPLFWKRQLFLAKKEITREIISRVFHLAQMSFFKQLYSFQLSSDDSVRLGNL